MHQSLTLRPDQTALLLIDLQEEHRQDPRYLVDGYGEVLENAAALLRAARQADMRVYHAGYFRDFNKLIPRPFEPMGDKGEPAFSAPGTSLTDICDEVRPENGEPVLWKNDLSCFAEQGFKTMLSPRPEWLIIAGVWTEACVAATIRDAVARGIRVLLVKDAVGSGTQAMSRSGVINLANRLYGGAVCDTLTAMALMGGTTLLVWQLVGSAPLRFQGDTIDQVFDTL
jgi:nicotinamidase-related amidase